MKDPYSKTLVLIRQFLKESNLNNTLSALELEAPELEEAAMTIPIQRPLLAIVEDDELNSTRLEFNRINLEKSIDSTLDGPVLRPKESNLFHLHSAVTRISNELFIVSGGSDKLVILTRESTGEIIHQIPQQSPILSLSIDPIYTSKCIATGMDGSFSYLDLETGTVQQHVKQHSKYCTHSCFSLKKLATASHDYTINIFDRSPQFNLVQSVKLTGIPESICWVDSTLCYGVRGDNCLTWMNGSIVEKTNMNTNGDDWVSFTPMDIVPSACKKFLMVYTDSKAGRIIIFQTKTSRIVKQLWGVQMDDFGKPKCCWISNRYIAATSMDDVVYIYDLKEDSFEKLQHYGTVRGLCFFENILFTCSYDKTIREHRFIE